VATARDESITNAMVVPTMLNRILDVIDADGEGLPSLRSLAYGGGSMPLPVIKRGDRAAAPRRLRQRVRAHGDIVNDLGAWPR